MTAWNGTMKVMRMMKKAIRLPRWGSLAKAYPARTLTTTVTTVAVTDTMTELPALSSTERPRLASAIFARLLGVTCESITPIGYRKSTARQTEITHHAARGRTGARRRPVDAVE